MSSDNTPHPSVKHCTDKVNARYIHGRPESELVPSRYAHRVGEIDVLVVSDGVLSPRHLYHRRRELRVNTVIYAHIFAKATPSILTFRRPTILLGEDERRGHRLVTRIHDRSSAAHENVSCAADSLDHLRVSGVDLDLASQPRNSEIDAAVEDIRV